MAPKRPHDDSDPQPSKKVKKSLLHLHKPTTPSGGKSSTGTKPYKLRPENLPNGAWKRKLLREKAIAIAQSKSARAYSKIRKQHEREKARQEAAKAKAKASGTVVYAPPVAPEPAETSVLDDGVKDARGVRDGSKTGSSSGSGSGDNEHFLTAESEPESEEGQEDNEDITQQQRNAFEGTRDFVSILEKPAKKAQEPSSNTSSETITSDASFLTNPALSKTCSKPTPDNNPTEPAPKHSADADQKKHQDQDEEDLATSGPMHPSRAHLLAQKSFLSTAAIKAARRREKLAHRQLERERRNEERNKAIADRERIRRMIRKAKEPGRDGKRKLGRESTVLLEQVRKMVSGRGNGRDGG